MTNIMWFRQDLRLKNNRALSEACKDSNIIPIYIYDDTNPIREMGAASKVWLYHSLKSLNESLDGNLKIFKGNPKDIIKNICQANDIKGLYFNKRYEKWADNVDNQISDYLKNRSIKSESYKGFLLQDPEDVLKEDDTIYKVFTPFYKKHFWNFQVDRITQQPTKINYSVIDLENSIHLNQLDLLPDHDWHKEIIEGWDISENGAENNLKNFLHSNLESYKTQRNYPFQDATSKLSPYLHFGIISPEQIWNRAYKDDRSNDVDQFLREIVWREFSYTLLSENPMLHEENFKEKFDNFKWNNPDHNLKKWQKGKTGVPIVDAGMRQLYKTGYMHNRVRMIVASFLIKNLLIDWREGEKWFWDCLFDADPASNSAGWQWVAGSGADAAPYFRIFNPISQAEKYDPDEKYIKQYIPELKDIGSDLFDFSDNKLSNKTSYPKPIVDLSKSRKIALEMYEKL